jgi:hypothetical protein
MRTKELEKEITPEATLASRIRAERIKWGFCPDCGQNLHNDIVAFHHQGGICPDVKEGK